MRGFKGSRLRRFLSFVLLLALPGLVQAQVRITEFMYQGSRPDEMGEFVEFTNLGSSAVDLTGWSFDDDSRAPGTVALGGIGLLAPGESAILTDIPASEFRAAWGLCDAAKVVGDNGTGLGRNDEINLYDANGELVDRLTYGDNDNAPGTIRARYRSGRLPVASAAGLGANNVALWVLSSPGDEEESWTATSGDVGSPGRSVHAPAPFDPCKPVVRITEFMYQGADGEFVEFTNVGGVPADLTGWSFDDDDNVPGTLALGSIGTLAPGESAILTESSASAFRSAWNLCDGVKVVGGSDQGLGRNDQLNLYDAENNLVDRLSYGDQTFSGTIRTQNVSGRVSAAGLGADDIHEWVFSSVGDVEGGRLSSGGDIGSPGRSAHGVAGFDPCLGLPGAPTVQVSPSLSSRHVDLPVNGGGAIGAAIDDPTDPAARDGIVFVFDDPDGDATALEVTVGSSHPAVVDADGLQWQGAGAQRTLRIVPHGVGRTRIEVKATDAEFKTGVYWIDYAASAASSQPETTRFHTGASDASAALAVDADWMFVADDENQVLRLYSRRDSGLHQAGFDVTASLALTDIDGGVPREVDIEGSTRIGNRIFWIGSHGNQATGNHNARPNRRRVFATDLDGAGILAGLSYAGRYDHLLEDMIGWDNAGGHGLGEGFLGLAAASAPNVSPELPSGLNIEGLSIAPDGSTALVAFRAPRLPAGSRDLALVVPVLDFDALVTGAAPGSQAAGSAAFEPPILLDLGGRAIRSLERNAYGDYLIVAGPSGSVDPSGIDFRLFLWSGSRDDAPVLLDADLSILQSGGSFEGIVEVPVGRGPDTLVQLVVDTGDFDYYAEGVPAKELSERRQAKFRSEWVRIDLPAPGPSIFSDDFEAAD